MKNSINQLRLFPSAKSAWSAVEFSSARQRLHDEDFGIGTKGVGKVFAVLDGGAVREDHDMGAHLALLIEDIAAQRRHLDKGRVERLGHGGSLNAARRGLGLMGEMGRELDERHGCAGGDQFLQ